VPSVPCSPLPRSTTRAVFPPWWTSGRWTKPFGQLGWRAWRA